MIIYFNSKNNKFIYVKRGKKICKIDNNNPVTNYFNFGLIHLLKSSEVMLDVRLFA